jgi:capsular polysaccharide export protein
MLVAPGERHVLFLQGPGSLFFYRLAQACQSSGMTVSKINLCAGDYLFWPRAGAIAYRGPIETWAAFVEQYIISNGVSDLVLFSDSRPYHRRATDVARSLGINVFVFENGYFRPDWITLEQGGVNGRSPFPRERSEILALAAAAGERVAPSRSLRRSRRLVLGDVAFHFASWLGSPFFPRYLRHRAPHPLAEAAGWVLKAAKLPGKLARSRERWQGLREGGRPLFFYPLQLDHDFQLTVDSDFTSLAEATRHILASFAAHAPSDAILLVKNHPRDNNLIDRERETCRLAGEHGIAERVVFLEAGSNPDIFRHCAGMVTINSTMGTSALFHQVPVCVLGRAVYDLEGLTHRGGLDSFWQAPTPPDPDYFQAFRRALIHAAQIQGEFGETAPGEGHFGECLLRIHLTPFRPAGLNLARTLARSEEAPAGVDIHGPAAAGSTGR